MQRHIFAKFVLASALLIVTTATPLAAGENPNKAGMTILNYARVTDHHKIFTKLQGDWRGQGTLVSKDGGASEKILCKANYKMILGGRFVEQKTTCKGAGFSFDGIAHFGYDILSKSYVGSTMSTVDSGISTLRGRKKGNVIQFTITHNNVNLRKRVQSKANFTIDKDGRHVYEIIAKNKTGNFVSLMKISFSR